MLHRTNRYENNWIEQDHRGIKQRTRPMSWFGSLESAARFCLAFDELRNFYRTPGTRLSLSEKRRHHQDRTQIIIDLVLAA